MTLQEIDTLCDEFEAALRRGDTILIEDILPKVEESQRADLLKELLEIEVQFTLERSPSDKSFCNIQESLQQRFPDNLVFIQSLFRRIARLRQIGDYEILGELGRGGMGIVYKAKHKLLQQMVAIKVLSQALVDDSQAVGRFKREMQLIGGLSHPNIVRALNAGEIDGTLYLAMEFVDGVPLQKLVEGVRTKTEQTFPILPLGAACEAIRQAALGLQEVYELKLVHRDIKPANLMLDHRGTVKILDLGLGKFAEEHRADYHSSLTMAGMVIGTVDYISPEQCENSGEADVRSDLYSLGCSLYFLLTGKPVYSGSQYDTMRKKLMAHIVGEVPAIRQVIPTLPKEIEAILKKVLAKNPAERFQTPLEFADALAPFASPDELWIQVRGAIPTSAGAGTMSSSRHSNSPYGYSLPSKQSIVKPINRMKWVALVVAMNFLIFGLGIGAAFYYYAFAPLKQTLRLVDEAEQAAEKARTLREQWKMAEAQEEYQKAAQLMRRVYDEINAPPFQKMSSYYRTELAMTRWYHGDSRTASRNLDSILDTISNVKDEEAKAELAGIRMLVQERRADFTLFGGAASGVNVERFADRIFRYNEAAGTDKPRRTVRWKQAILYSLQGDLEEAEKLLKENPALPNESDVYVLSLRQLAEAVVFYYQQEGRDNRDDKLRAFQRQFSLPSNALRESAIQPEIMELLLFGAEFLLNDSIKREDWKALDHDFMASYNGMGNFLRQYPGATPYLRRFNELLIRSAVLLHGNAEEPRVKRRYLTNIAQLLERMRRPSSDTVDGEKPTLIYFFLPESNKPEEGFVLFYPQDGREGVLYPLPLTRQMARQGGRVPSLDVKLQEQIAMESKKRIFWDDTAVWARAEEALTEKEYPYKDVLPLR
jgi:serine/threonine protein kinase